MTYHCKLQKALRIIFNSTALKNISDGNWRKHKKPGKSASGAGRQSGEQKGSNPSETSRKWRGGIPAMGVKQATRVNWLLVCAVFLPISCSVIQLSLAKNTSSRAAPLSGTIEQIPESSPQIDPQRKVSQPSTAKVKYFTHIVKWPEENLGSIARWYSGSAKNWMRLAKFNPGIDAGHIKVGDLILIPEHLLKTREPMPIDFLPASIDKKNELSSPVVKQPVESKHEHIPGPTPVQPRINQIPVDPSQRSSPPKAPQPSKSKGKYFTHKIKWPGENLVLIARWYTGSAKNWTRLVAFNPGIDPRRIEIGDSVLISEHLLKTREPMPIDFLSSSTGKKKESSPLSIKQPAISDKIELFGPIDTESQVIGVDDSHSPVSPETIE